MAIISKDKLFEKLAGSFWNAGVTFERTNPVPLEKYSIFKTLAEAETYATTSPVAYPGQPIAVVGDDNTTLYFIDNDGSLKSIASGSSTEGALDAAKNYTNKVSADLSTDYVAKIKATDDKLSGYVLTANAESATASDKLLKSSSVSAIAKAYVDALDVAEKTATQAQTIKSISETDGKISIELQDIQIGKDAVTGLTADLATITKLANDVSSTAAATFLSASTFDAYKTDVGLTAASSSNHIATKQDITDSLKDLANAMHFLGPVTPTSDQKDLDAIADTYENPAKGDVVIITTNAKEYVYDGSTWRELGDESQHASKAELETAKTELKEYADGTADAVRTELKTVSSDIDTSLKSEIKTRGESDAKFTTDIETLSGAIDNKISVGDYANDAYAWRDNSNLSVVKIGADDYHKLVANGGPIDENTIYIVSSDNINAYGERITQVGDPISADDAVNKKYVDAIDTKLTASIAEVKSNALSGIKVGNEVLTATDNVITLAIDLIDCGNASTADLTGLTA